MTKLSVNINKIATLRNARGGNIPNVVQAAVDAELFGAQGITVHPRPDRRHITYTDVYDLKEVITTEFNIEGYPNEKFMQLVTKVKPHQVTLVPDPPEAITSNAGWDTVENLHFLQDIVSELQTNNIRSSIFVDTDKRNIEYAAKTGVNRVELYTEPYAIGFSADRFLAVKRFVDAANIAQQIGLGVNAGHDLNLENLHFFVANIPFLKEVSIGHALISDAIYFGFENTIQMYLKQLMVDDDR